MAKKDKKSYRCPKMGDKKGFNPPPSAGENTYSGRLEKQLEETISAVVLSETYPDENRVKRQSKNEK